MTMETGQPTPSQKSRTSGFFDFFIMHPIEQALSRVSGVKEMTSNTSLGTTSIAVQFDLDKNIQTAASDVQTATSRPKRQGVQGFALDCAASDPGLAGRRLHILVAMIGVILLTGIVKKNGIMLVDFAIGAERKEA